jgi:hypothetical protein
MAVFKSKYRELTFYVDGKLYAFSSGSFSTDDDRVIAVLEKLKDAKRIDATEEKPKTEEPAPAPKAPRKSSGK